ncbi:glycosyltransferase [Roseimaritima ulvae]|uniref:Glycosyltransferase EpsD n=1 Tax=Roseimaritima ulvae TaxID=980254 RepID=A0A5B9QYK4_9BACT|nr:glycosyltransferase [Roseimaritima ulvae]QEG42475.1 Putative glycosyltransferase EpsD [Roseimaritima ulvae]
MIGFNTTQSTPPAPVRVGFVMHKMQVAGAEVLVKQIIEQLAGEIEATVFCLDGLGELGQQLRDAGTPVIVLDRQPGFDRQVAKRLADEVNSRRIDVLHAHQYTPFFYSALARLRHRCQTKILFTEHGRHYPDIVSWKRRSANRWLLQRYAEVTTACCDFSTAALRQIEGFPRAITLRNGVVLDELPPRGDAQTQQALRAKLGLQADTPYAACVARFHPVKDHATLIRGWRQVHQQLPGAKLLLVGDGPERANIEQLIQQLSPLAPAAGERVRERGPTFASSIKFLGIRNDVADILRAVDVFTLTSVSEAASLTLLEAMASECASVVTDVGGNAEHLREGIDGFLTPRGDAEKLGERLTELLQSPDRCREMGTSARRRVIEAFNLDDVIAAYAQHYKTLQK